MTGPTPKPKPKPEPLLHDRITAGAGQVQSASQIGATGKPSVSRGVIGGGAGGAAKGAAAGSLIGPEGTVIGAVAGAGLGAAGGGLKSHRAKRAAQKAKVAALGGGRQMLVGEFIACMVILALTPLTARHSADGPQTFIKRMAACCALFFVLGMISSAGKGPTKIAAACGGLITMALAVSDSDVFTALADKVSGTGGSVGAAGGDAAVNVANSLADDAGTGQPAADGSDQQQGG